MLRRSIVWPLAAGMYILINLGGAVYAAMMGELPHAGVHVALLLAGPLLARQLVPARWRSWSRPATTLPPHAMDESLTRLEQSLDAVAIEVERVGESQRYMTRLFSERGTPEKSEVEAPKGEGSLE
jgi:hypothetical protein